MGRGRPSSGGVKWQGCEWKTRVPDASMATGYRWLVVKPGLREDQRREAIAEAKEMQAAWARHDPVPVDCDRTNNESFRIWNESRARVAKFPNQVVSDKQMWNQHVPSWFGVLPTRATTSEHCVRVVADRRGGAQAGR